MNIKLFRLNCVTNFVLDILREVLFMGKPMNIITRAIVYISERGHVSIYKPILRTHVLVGSENRPYVSFLHSRYSIVLKNPRIIFSSDFTTNVLR